MTPDRFGDDIGGDRREYAYSAIGGSGMNELIHLNSFKNCDRQSQTRLKLATEDTEVSLVSSVCSVVTPIFVDHWELEPQNTRNTPKRTEEIDL